MKVSSYTSVDMPLKNLIGIVCSVAVGVWAYFGIIERINQLETDIGRLSNEKKNLCCAKCGNKATKMFKDEHICNGCFMIL